LSDVSLIAIVPESECRIPTLIGPDLSAAGGGAGAAAADADAPGSGALVSFFSQAASAEVARIITDALNASRMAFSILGPDFGDRIAGRAEGRAESRNGVISLPTLRAHFALSKVR